MDCGYGRKNCQGKQIRTRHITALATPIAITRLFDMCMVVLGKDPSCSLQSNWPNITLLCMLDFVYFSCYWTILLCIDFEKLNSKRNQNVVKVFFLSILLVNLFQLQIEYGDYKTTYLLKSLRRHWSLKRDYMWSSLVLNAWANQNGRKNDFGTRSCVCVNLISV